MKTRPLSLLACAALATSTFAQQKPGDPTKPSYTPRPSSGVIAPVATGPQQLVSPLPPGSGVPTTTNYSSAVVLPINDFVTVTDNIVVAGAGTYLFDVDLTTHITHTYSNDLEVVVFAPNGKRVTLAAYSGGPADDAYNGTVWDDTSLNSASTYAFAGVGASDLAPGGTFSSLIGDNPNGTWTIQIYDGAGADTGMSSGWQLKITTLSFGTSQTPSAPTTYTHSGLALPVLDFSTVSDTIAASGLGTNIAEVRVTTNITHTYAADQDIRLTSPAGTEVGLTNLNGGGSDNAFNGTLWFDNARTGLSDDCAGNYVYTNLVAAPQLTPDGDFTTLWGQNPNGNWTLSVYDNAGADTGSFDGWSLTIRTWGPGAPPPPVNYCTAGTTTNGCLATVGATNNPSISNAVPCVITVSNVEGQKNGIVFYGIAGPNNVPWATGSSSFLCVKPPTQRAGTTNSGGTLGGCNGSLVLNWDAYQAGNPGALGQPWAVGNKAYVQGWFRDPAAIKTTNLSNGLELTYQP